MFHLKVIVSLLHKIAGNGINWRPAPRSKNASRNLFLKKILNLTVPKNLNVFVLEGFFPIENIKKPKRKPFREMNSRC